MTQVIVLIGLLLSPCLAWWATGHMLVAQIAQLSINQSTYEKVQHMIDQMPDFPNSNTLVTSSVWADDLKGMGILNFNNWHFVDIPWTNHTNFVPPREAYDYPDTIITETQNALKGLRSPAPTPYMSALLVKFLIHFVGDMHQPLHCSSFFSPEFPRGDAGGNGFKVTFQGKSTNLHSFWDSGADMYSQNFPRPLDASNAEYLFSEARRLMTKFPPSAFGSLITIENPAIWANESYKVAVDAVYANGALRVGSELSSDYIMRAREVVERQIVLAGYRLGHLLQSLPNTAVVHTSLDPAWVVVIILAMGMTFPLTWWCRAHVLGAFITTVIFYFLFRLKYKPREDIPIIEVERLLSARL